MRGIADTGLLVAFANRRDVHHEWALGVVEQITEPLLTCEAVLAETAFHLGDVSLVLDMRETGLVELGFDIGLHWRRLRELAGSYADRRPDLADLCLVCMSELFPDHDVITVDESDFRIYRRNKREVIPLICPPRQ